METNASKSPHTLFWIAGIAVTVFSAVGIAAVMGWIPTSTSSPADKIVLSTPLGAPAKPAVASTNSGSALAREQARERAQEQAREDARRPARARCAECGVIESVREIETKGEGTGLGAVGGAVVGGVLGHQVGGGSGQKIATVVGAVGGAVAGNEVEKHVKSTKSYEITVRFEDGSSRAISEARAPTWRAGDRVKVVNGVIQSNA
jgi:outer membrane lipoprotein SlyB